MGLFDKEAEKFTQFIPTPNVGVLKRDFKNTMKPNNLYYEAAEDFDVYQLAELDDVEGSALSIERILAFKLIDIKNDLQVQ